MKRNELHMLADTLIKISYGLLFLSALTCVTWISIYGLGFLGCYFTECHNMRDLTKVGVLVIVSLIGVSSIMVLAFIAGDLITDRHRH